MVLAHTSVFANHTWVFDAYCSLFAILGSTIEYQPSPEVDVGVKKFNVCANVESEASNALALGIF